ncbi:MAG: response regulator transcription factor [Thiovulaceae bacterium]|nr:response regulator transcription factor [Sulfurimonadaceae bacterium]
MQLVLFSKNLDMIDIWSKQHAIENSLACHDLESLSKLLQTHPHAIVVADFDTVAPEINKLIAANGVPKNLVVLERTPAIITGKMLLSHAIKAYGNSRMSTTHFNQMLQAVQEGKVWSYPELTSALILIKKQSKINEEAENFIRERLTPQEIEVVHLILEGFTNDAIASALHITTRTVKAHITSIFTKLHVNDRISLVLLLK